MPADLKEAVVIEGGVSRYGALLIVCDEQRGKNRRDQGERESRREKASEQATYSRKGRKSNERCSDPVSWVGGCL